MESPGSSQRAVTPIGAHIKNLQQKEEQQHAPAIRNKPTATLNWILLDPPVRGRAQSPAPHFSTASPSRAIAAPNRLAAVRNGFKRYGITCPAKTRCQPDRLI